MAFVFKPAIYKNAALYELPRPVTSLRLRDGWDFERFKVPLASGESLVGHSRQGVAITLAGAIAFQAGTLKTSEEQMFEELEDLRDAFSVTSSDEKYEFFLYHDATSGVYRKLQNCTTVKFEFDLSDENQLVYSAEIFADDPDILTSAPGT